jgi:hypothetical protein
MPSLASFSTHNSDFSIGDGLSASLKAGFLNENWDKGIIEPHHCDFSAIKAFAISLLTGLEKK